VRVVPVYVEIPGGFERAVATLESHLRRAGYVFCTGEPMPVTLEETRRNLLGSKDAEVCSAEIGAGVPAGVGG